MKPFVVKRKTVKPGHLASIDQCHEYAIGVAEAAFKKKGTAPFRWVMRYRERMVIMDTPWETPKEKAAHTDMMRFYMLLLGIETYSFIHEAWVAPPTEQEMAAINAGKITIHDIAPPSKHQNREDVLMVSTFAKGPPREYRMTRYGVRYGSRKDQPKFGRLLARDDWKNYGDQHFSGAMWDLIADPTAQEQAMLNEFAGVVHDVLGEEIFTEAMLHHRGRAAAPLTPTPPSEEMLESLARSLEAEKKKGDKIIVTGITPSKVIKL